MRDDAAKRPAKQVVRAVRMNRLNPVGIVGRHVADRSWCIADFAVWGLLDPDDRAVEVTTKNLIGPTHPAHRMQTEHRNTGAVLQNLNGDYFSPRRGVR